MKTAVVFYSFGGFTKKYSQKEAELRGAEIFEVQEAKKRTIFGAFFKGCPAAMHQKSVPLKGQPLNLEAFDTIIIAAPVWAGFPAPAFNSIVAMLPSNKEIEIHLTSGGGDTSKNSDAIKDLAEKSGSKIVCYKDIKSETKK